MYFINTVYKAIFPSCSRTPSVQYPQVLQPFLLRLVHAHGKPDLLFFRIDLNDPNFDRITDRYYIHRMLDIFAAHFGNMHQTIVLYTDVYKCSKIHYISN